MRLDDNGTGEGLVPQAELKRRLGGVSDMTVWRMCRDGELPAPMKRRGRNVWTEADWRTYCERLARTRAQAAA